MANKPEEFPVFTSLDKKTVQNMLHYHTQKENIKLNITENIVNDIYYAFRFRDLSKEAIMILAESLIK